MSDFNPLDRAKVAVHRSSFDLSSKKLFTAKVGEILPCYWQIAIPGSKYRISSDWFTRTVPVNTAAYTRIKEYYDFYAVPLRLISRALPQAFTQMTDYMTSAASNTANTEMLTSVPNTTLNLLSLSLQTINGKDVFDDAGLPYVYGASKVLDMLGYGSFIASSSTAKANITSAYLGKSYSGVDAIDDTTNPLVYSVSQTVSLLPLLDYQKIYYDFFSESQWEKHLAYSYNVDYWDGKSQLNLAPEMLQLRYANYPKDYYMGMLPNSQYGSVATLPGVFNPQGSSNSVVAVGNPNVDYVINPASSESVSTSGTFSSQRAVQLNSDLSALSIRVTEYLQRWKEVVQFSSKDYSDQMAAQFGIKAPEYMGNHAHYIGG